MRTSRMLEMIYLLLEKRQVTSKELAEHFNVSTKTIYRDVEELSKAGIPISMQQGVKGGIVLSDDYKVKETNFTTIEMEALIKALDDIKRLPNAKLNYALEMLKQYFNEASTLWINTDDVALDIQDKFHQVKTAIIECNVIDFQYYTGEDFVIYHVEPYELRIKKDIWTVIVRNISYNTFEELYLARIKNLEIKNNHFKRRKLPDKYFKKYTGEIKTLRFEVLELSEDLLNRIPIESFTFDEKKTYIDLKVRGKEQITKVIQDYNKVRLINENTNKKTPI